MQGFVSIYIIQLLKNCGNRVVSIFKVFEIRSPCEKDIYIYLGMQKFWCFDKCYEVSIPSIYGTIIVSEGWVGRDIFFVRGLFSSLSTVFVTSLHKTSTINFDTIPVTTKNILWTFYALFKQINFQIMWQVKVIMMK